MLGVVEETQLLDAADEGPAQAGLHGSHGLTPQPGMQIVGRDVEQDEQGQNTRIEKNLPPDLGLRLCQAVDDICADQGQNPDRAVLDDVEQGGEGQELIFTAVEL